MEARSSFFMVEERGTTIPREIIAGLTTFATMAYIVFVNPGMFMALGIPFGAQYVATCLGSILGTLLIGLLANLPLAQAPGMGLNAFFVYTVCLTYGFSYENALVFVLLDGIIFILLTVFNLRGAILDAIPNDVKGAISKGIGLFICFLGLQDAGIIVNDESTLVNLHSFNVFGKVVTIQEITPLLITIFTFCLIVALEKLRVPGAVLISLAVGAVIYYLTGGAASLEMQNPGAAFQEWNEYSLGVVFTKGIDFSAYYAAGHTQADLIITLVTTALAFCIVDMFDTLGTLYGACASMLVKNEETGEMEVPNLKMGMLSDAIATTGGAIFGTSTVTTYVEASAGVAAGGRTGITSIVVAIMFGLALLLEPIAGLVPACSYAAALIYVGYLMLKNIKDMKMTFPAFITMAAMPLTYSISYGIAFGLLSYIIIEVLTAIVGIVKERDDGETFNVPIPTWIISILFVTMLFTSH